MSTALIFLIASLIQFCLLVMVFLTGGILGVFAEREAAHKKQAKRIDEAVKRVWPKVETEISRGNKGGVN